VREREREGGCLSSERRGKIDADYYSGIEFACKYGAKRGKLCAPKAFRRARCVRLFIIMGGDVTAVSAVAALVSTPR
jgi:hypothetical protein